MKRRLPVKSENLFDFEKSLAAELLKGAEYYYLIIDEIKEYILRLARRLDMTEYVKLGHEIYVSRSARIAPTASILGPAIIGGGTEIRSGAIIRGSVIIGREAVIGNSSEVKNSIIFDRAALPHYNYVGDSVIGYGAHFGAGAVTSNLKSIKSTVSVVIEGEKVDTGRRKLGAAVGDGAEIGCGAVLCPGTIIGKGSVVYPLCAVRGTVGENTIYKGYGNTAIKEL